MAYVAVRVGEALLQSERERPDRRLRSIELVPGLLEAVTQESCVAGRHHRCESTVEQATRGFTRGNAQCLGFGWEDELGSIEKGKLAGLVVIDQNLQEVPAGEIHEPGW